MLQGYEYEQLVAMVVVVMMRNMPTVEDWLKTSEHVVPGNARSLPLTIFYFIF